MFTKDNKDEKGNFESLGELIESDNLDIQCTVRGKDGDSYHVETKVTKFKPFIDDPKINPRVIKSVTVSATGANLEAFSEIQILFSELILFLIAYDCPIINSVSFFISFLNLPSS